MTKLIEQLRQLERLDQLIRMKATGSPKDLARRLEVSERKVHRMIAEMKLMGLPIEYCKCSKSYSYVGEVEFFFQLLVDDDCFFKIKGGFSCENVLDRHFLAGRAYIFGDRKRF